MADHTNHQSDSDTIDTSHNQKVQHLIDTLQGEHIGGDGKRAIIFRMVMSDHFMSVWPQVNRCAQARRL